MGATAQKPPHPPNGEDETSPGGSGQLAGLLFASSARHLALSKHTKVSHPSPSPGPSPDRGPARATEGFPHTHPVASNAAPRTQTRADQRGFALAQCDVCVCARASLRKGERKPSGFVVVLRRLMLAAREATTHIESLAAASRENRMRPRHHDDGTITTGVALVWGQTATLLAGGAVVSERYLPSPCSVPRKQPPLLPPPPARYVCGASAPRSAQGKENAPPRLLPVHSAFSRRCARDAAGAETFAFAPLCPLPFCAIRVPQPGSPSREARSGGSLAATDAAEGKNSEKTPPEKHGLSPEAPISRVQMCVETRASPMVRVQEVKQTGS